MLVRNRTQNKIPFTLEKVQSHSTSLNSIPSLNKSLSFLGDRQTPIRLVCVCLMGIPTAQRLVALGMELRVFLRTSCIPSNALSALRLLYCYITITQWNCHFIDKKIEQRENNSFAQGHTVER